MTDFTNADCPVCKKDFSAEKPVICPDCGTPYHRDCWAVSGHCSFEAAHKSGFVWRKPEPEKIFSDIPITPQPEPAFTFDRKSLYDKTPPPEERFIFGVSEKEIAVFQGSFPNSDPFRFMKYRKIASGQSLSQRISLNIFAAFFSPFYFFYSRMRVAGFIAAFIIFFLRLPLLFSGTQALGNASMLFGILGLGFQLLLALFFDYFYLLWMVEKIKIIRNDFLLDNPEYEPGFTEPADADLKKLGDDYYAALQGAGRPGLLYGLEGVAVTLLLLLTFEFVLAVV